MVLSDERREYIISIFEKILEVTGINRDDMSIKRRMKGLVRNRTIVVCLLSRFGITIGEIVLYFNINRSSVYNMLKHEPQMLDMISIYMKKMGYGK